MINLSFQIAILVALTLLKVPSPCPKQPWSRKGRHYRFQGGRSRWLHAYV
jgi:hypothetical protein